MLKVAIYIFEGWQTCKRFLLSIKVFLDTEHIGREQNQPTHILGGAIATHKLSAVVAEVVVFQALDVIAVRLGIALDYTLIALIGYILTNTVLVISAYNTLTLAAVLCIKLHHCVKRSARTGEEIKNVAIFLRV